LTKLAGVSSSSTVSGFFKKEFKGHGQYRALCRRSLSDLVNALKMLNGEFSPHLLYARTPPPERKDGE
jgi:hypothetical protein